MATISNNEIKIKYTLDTTDLANATQLFDRLSAEDRQLLNDLKRLQAQFQQTGQAAGQAGQNISRGNKAAAGSLTDLQNRVKDLTNRLNNLNPTASNYETILRRLQRAQANLNIATAQTNDRLNKSQKEFRALDSTIGGLGKTILAVFSVQQFMAFGRSVLDTTIKMEGLRKAIEFTSKSAIGGQAAFEFLKKTSEEFGIPLEAAAEGFRTLSAAAGRANISIMDQREMFTDLAKAMSALSLTQQDASLIFFGFGQLLSKNKVSAQELYHQIGERLPIAMEAAQIAAAKITGKLKVTSAELIQLVEDGKLLSSEFAPEFTKALGEIAKSGAYVNTLGKDTQRLSNAWEEFKTTVGDSAALGAFIRFLQSAVKYVDGLAGAMNYLGKTGFFQEKSYREFKKFEKEVLNTYDKTLVLGGQRFKELDDINAQYQKSLTDKTAGGDLLRLTLEAQFNEKRKKAAQDVKNSILREEQIIANSKKELTKIGTGDVLLGLSREQKARKIKLQDDIALAKSAKSAFESLYGTLPTLTKPTLEVEDPEKAAKKRRQAQEDAYRKELDRLEAQKKAKEDILKATMEDDILRDIEIAKNNEYWNNQMYQVDLKYSKMGIELAKNNKVKRAAEVKLDRATQVQLVKDANEKADKIERDYIAKAEEAIQDAARKRQQALQTEQEKELAQTEDFYDDQLKALEDKFKEAYEIAKADKLKQKQLQDNFNAEEKKLDEARQLEIQSIIRKFREQEQIDASRNANDVAAIYIQAAGLRNANLAKSEQQRLDIQDETNKALISNEIDKNTKEMNLLSQNLGEYATKSVSEKKDLNDKLIAQNVLLNEQLTEVDRAGEQRRYEVKLEKLNLTLQLAQTISDGINSIVQQQYANELTLLEKKYDQDIRLAGDNEQKKAQLEQDLQAKQKEIKIKQFNADKMAAMARIIFESAAQIAANALNPVTLPYIIAIQAAQLALVAAQPVPEFAEGTKGRKFKGGRAMVGERGTEKIITESGKVYYTPDTATLMDLPKGSQVIPNHALTQRELFWANAINDGRPINPGGGIENKLDRIGGILESLPVHQINMDERGFEKFVRTPRRTTKILNNRFPVTH